MLREKIYWKATFKKKNTWNKTEIVPDQKFSNQYCIKRYGHHKIFCTIFVTWQELVYNTVCGWCQHVKPFWNKLEEFVCDCCNTVHSFTFSDKIILFGTDDHFKSNKVLDFIILHAEFSFTFADMKIWNLSYVHLEKSWKKIWHWSMQPKVETNHTQLFIRLGLL